MTNKEKTIYYTIEYFRDHTVPSTERNIKAPRCEYIRQGVRYPDTQYDYFRQLINDTLRQIRLGFAAYVFNYEQIRTVLRYEPKAKFRYLEDSESFEVSLAKEDCYWHEAKQQA